MRAGLLTHQVDVARLSRAVVAGKQTVTSVSLVTALPCLLEAMAAKNLALAEGWIERASYVMTWVQDVGMRAGDIVTFRSTKHIAKAVRADLQGHYFTAILEMEAQ